MRFWFTRRVGVQVLLHYRRTLGRSFGELDAEWDEVRFGTGLTVGF